MSSIRLEAGEKPYRRELYYWQTEKPSDNIVHRRENPILVATSPSSEGCDKFCSDCVVPYTRGKERSRTFFDSSVLSRCGYRRPLGIPRFSSGANVNSDRDPEGSAAPRSRWLSVGQIRGIRRSLHHKSSGATLRSDIVEVDDHVPCSATTYTCPSSRVPQGTQADGTRVHAGVVPGSGSPWDQGSRVGKRAHLNTDYCWLSREEERILFRNDTFWPEVQYDCVRFQYSVRPNTPALS